MLLFLLLTALASAAGVSSWHPDRLEEALRIGFVDNKAPVLEVRGYDLRQAGAVTGLIVGRSKEKASALVVPVYQKGGEERIGPGVRLMGSERVLVAGLLDLEADGEIALDYRWARSVVVEPEAPARRPVLVVQSEQRFGDGSNRVSAVLWDLRDPTAMVELATIVVKTLSAVEPGAPPPPSLGVEVRSLAVRKGALELTERPIPGPKTGVLMPDRLRRFVLEGNRLVEPQ